MNLAKTLPTGVRPEQTAVVVELWDAKRTTMLACRCTVDHYGDQPVHVHFQDGWRRLVSLVGLDAYHTATEGYLYTLAVQAFQRGGR